MFTQKGPFTTTGLMGIMLVSLIMTVPFYMMMREMSDSLALIADKIASSGYNR
ncbi:MAG: hypothetical protein ACOX3A_05000 [bacterium]